MVDANALKALVDAGTIVICLAALLTMWRAYNTRIDEHIADLRKLAFREPVPPTSRPHLPGKEFAPSVN